MFTAAANQLEVQMVDGNFSSGRVEVRQGTVGRWGSICDSGWDMNDSRVVCNMLGFE